MDIVVTLDTHLHLDFLAIPDYLVIQDIQVFLVTVVLLDLVGIVVFQVTLDIQV